MQTINKWHGDDLYWFEVFKDGESILRLCFSSQSARNKKAKFYA